MFHVKQALNRPEFLTVNRAAAKTLAYAEGRNGQQL
jgi:hypothetical protein